MLPSDDILSAYSNRLDWTNILAKRHDAAISRAASPIANQMQGAMAGLRFFRTKHCVLGADVVSIGHQGELSAGEREHFQTVLQAFVPWKKGPFEFFGTMIDAEWRCDFKWNRLRPRCEPTTGLRVADIGCNNGYYMFRMAHENPELVVGFEPYPRMWHNFHLIQGFAQIPSLAFEPLGVEDIHWFPEFFDQIYCMGILYHHTDPVGLLRKMRAALVPNGLLVIDCQGIEGTDSIALVPEGRYTGAGGVWFLPTARCLHTWLIRAGFRDAFCFFDEALSPDEQRSTPWAPIKSLADFLSADKRKTIEGYPAPRRFYVKARK